MQLPDTEPDKPNSDPASPATANDQSICQICGSSEIGDYVNTSEAHYRRCRHCGLIFNALTLSEQQVVSDYYNHQDYFQQYIDRRDHKIQSSRRTLELIKDLAPGGLLVDIGCGVGDTLAAAEQLGYQALGIDIGDYPVQFCQRMGHQAQVGSLTNTGLPDECADLVTAWDVVEHIPVTADGLVEVNRILKPDGLFVFIVPNGWYLKACLLKGRYRCYAGKWAQTHMVYHNPRTIHTVLKQTGFVPLPVPWLQHHKLTNGRGAAMQEILIFLPRTAFRLLRGWLRLNRNLFMIARKSVGQPTKVAIHRRDIDYA